VTWALERAPNPRVVRVHTTVELTRATIEKYPPASPPEGLRSLLAVDGVRSIDLHRYRARLNLSPGCDAKAAWEGVARTIEAAWGAPAPLPDEPPPRAFEVAYEGPRIVAESPEMAGPDPTLPVPGPRGGRGHPRGWQGMGPAGPPVLLGGRGGLGPRGFAQYLAGAALPCTRSRCPSTSRRTVSRARARGDDGARCKDRQDHGASILEECSRCESGFRHPSALTKE
jgi:hypothetical protein